MLADALLDGLFDWDLPELFQEQARNFQFAHSDKQSTEGNFSRLFATVKVQTVRFEQFHEMRCKLTLNGKSHSHISQIHVKLHQVSAPCLHCGQRVSTRFSTLAGLW